MRETKYWTWHIAAGALILVLLGIHMTIMHLDDILGWMDPAGGKAVDWTNVLARSRMVFFTITYILLLGAALYHGFYGLRVILFELSLKPGARRAINVTLWAAGVGLFALGTAAAIAARMM
jgi:succinate dehydrogenase / fumarate reductase membrane anchor subunit